MKKRFFPVIIALCAVLAFSGVAMAAGNLINLKTTVPNIPKSLCYQAGTISMEFSAETVLTSGDIIQFTLNNNVLLCKNIDFYVRLHSGTNPFIPGVDSSLPVFASDVLDALNVTGVPVPAADGTYDYGFLVRGNVGSQIITLTLVARNILTGELYVNPDPVGNPAANENFVIEFDTFNLATDVITVSLFDEKATTVYLAKDDPAVADAVPGVKEYIVDLEPADNAMCIDTMTRDFQLEFVEASPDSIPNVTLGGIKNTFSGERQVAHILDANEYALVTCKDAPMVGNIDIGEGQNAACDPFYFDAYNQANYCPNTHEGNKIIIQALTTPFPVSDYTVTVEVLVNGLSGDLGVYIADEEMYYVSDTTLDAVCEPTGVNPLAFDNTKYKVPGTCSGCAGALPGGSGCTVADANKVIAATTQLSTLGFTQANGFDYLRLILPGFRYDNTIVKEGDVVSVRLIVEQSPCGTVFEEEIQIGTFGCDDATTPTTLLYPYLTKASGTYFWSAYAITNISGADGTVTLYMYESDGDAFMGTKATPIPAHTIWATRLDDSISDPDITWEQIAGTGTPGDASAYIEAKTTFSADGFAFIAGSPTGESMGYLPRVNGHD